MELKVIAAKGTTMEFKQKVTLTINCDESRTLSHNFYISNRYSHRAILGMDFMIKFQVVINADKPSILLL